MNDQIFEFLNKIRPCFTDKRRFAMLQNLLQHLAEESSFGGTVSTLTQLVAEQDFFTKPILDQNDIDSLQNLLMELLLNLSMFSFQFPKEQEQIDSLWKNVKFFVQTWNNDIGHFVDTSRVPRGCPAGSVGVQGSEGAPGVETAYLQESINEPETTCCICLEHPPTTMSADCKHRVLCLTCTVQLAKSKAELKCPVCRTKVITLITKI